MSQKKTKNPSSIHSPSREQRQSSRKRSIEQGADIPAGSSRRQKRGFEATCQCRFVLFIFFNILLITSI